MTRSILVAMMLTWAAPAWPCDVPAKFSAADPAPEAVIRRARTIVRVRAEGIGDATPRPAIFMAQTVRFRVLATLKGTVTTEEIEFNGVLDPPDPDGTVPVAYTPGSAARTFETCYDPTYIEKAEYLLLLGPDEGLLSVEGDLTPYWEPTRPTNERVVGDNDPWLLFVRQTVEKQR